MEENKSLGTSKRKLIEEMPDLPSNHEFDPNIFQEHGFLDEGSFGTITVAKNTINNQYVALKKLKTFNYCDFHNELTLMLSLQHQHIVTCLGYCRTIDQENEFCLVLEYSPYGSLDGIIDNTNDYPEISLRHSIAWIKDITKALLVTHQQNIIHNDIKPSNYLVYQNNLLKLGDFGLSKTFQITQKYINCGSILYAAPEILNRTQGISFQSDIFSLGKTIYHILQREIPDLLKPIKQLVDKMIESIEKTFSHSLNSSLRRFMLFIYQCIELNPQQRPSLELFLQVIIEAEMSLGGDIRDTNIIVLPENVPNLPSQNISEENSLDLIRQCIESNDLLFTVHETTIYTMYEFMKQQQIIHTQAAYYCQQLISEFSVFNNKDLQEIMTIHFLPFLVEEDISKLQNGFTKIQNIENQNPENIENQNSENTKKKYRI